jgi:signal transduction histidine kinase
LTREPARDPPPPAVMSETLLAGLLGYCLAAPDGTVLRREGALSQWAPEPGRPLFAHPVIESFRDPVAALRGGDRDMLVPGVGLQDTAGALKLDIRFVWIERGAYLLVTSTQAAARAELEAATAQARREQRILEEQLRARELRLVGQRRLMALFIANVPAAIAMLDHDLRYVAVSGRWRADFGLSVEAAGAGESLAASLPGVSARWTKGLAGCLAGADVDCPLDTLTGAHGRTEWVRWRFLPWQLAAIEPGGAAESGVLVFCETITETVEQARKLEEQARRLRSANVDMKNFSLALSHDLQAPLRQMVKFAQLLDSDSGGALEGSGRDFLNEIHAAGARMQRMIASLLRYLRIAAQQPALRRVDLSEAVAAALANLRSDTEASRARITVGALPQVQGDAELLTILFQNLVQNSLKYAVAPAPAIDVSAMQSGGAWQIAYRDNGPGIPAQSALKAFDMFQRLDDRKGIAGTGVGLAVCRWIAEVHNGAIAIDPGCKAGLRIVLTLPMQRDAAVSSDAPA